MRPITIDFEASCLPRDGKSFPIEVGIADALGNQHAWLIKPHDRWSDWTWAAEAEELHGISRETLERDGLSPEAVMTQLNAMIGENSIIADCWLDVFWLETLCEAADVPARFNILPLPDLLDDIEPTPAQLARAERAIAAVHVRRHRAGEDARHLALWLSALQQPETGRRATEEDQCSVSRRAA